MVSMILGLACNSLLYLIIINIKLSYITILLCKVKINRQAPRLYTYSIV